MLSRRDGRKSRASRRACARGVVVGLASVVACCTYDLGRPWQGDGGGGRLDGPAADFARPDFTHDALVADTHPAPDVVAQPDALVEVPELCFSGELNASFAGCPSGWTALAGASVCKTPVVANSASANHRWGAICQGGSEALFVQAICARGAGFRIVTKKGALGAAAVAACGPSEVVLGGGCSCSGGNALRTDDYEPTVEGWRCACDGAAVAAVRLGCIDAAGAQTLEHAVQRRTGLSGGSLTTSCGGGRVVAGGCDSEQLIVASGVASDGLDVWKCGFSAPAVNATVTAICLSALADCP